MLSVAEFFFRGGGGGAFFLELPVGVLPSDEGECMTASLDTGAVGAVVAVEMGLRGTVGLLEEEATLPLDELKPKSSWELGSEEESLLVDPFNIFSDADLSSDFCWISLIMEELFSANFLLVSCTDVPCLADADEDVGNDKGLD